MAEQEHSDARTGGDAADADWLAFMASREAGLRTRLVERYLPFARIMAGKLYAGRTHMEVEFDEYLQYARVGLIEAVDRYDPRRGFKFETYAASRISGAILNGLASYSEVHEQVLARKRLVRERVDLLRGAAPDAGEADADAVFAHLAELAIGLAVGFVLEQTGMHVGEREPLYQDNSYARIELRQLRQRIGQLLDNLPARQRQVMVYHYQQQLPFEQIAGMLRVTKGRVAQLHKEALQRLRDELRARELLDWSG